MTEKNPLSHLAALDASSPEGGAFRHLPVSRAKPPPFGGGGTAQAVTERVQPARAKQCFPRSAALSQKAALQMPFPITTPPVKRQFWKIRRFSRIAK